MDVSVILSTYNTPRALELSIWGYSVQTRRDFELVIADDGSGAETRALIAEMRSATGLPINHVWQDDDGFRKPLALNRAMVQAAGEYLLFSDADCIPREDFVQVHTRFAAPGRFLSGGRVCLNREAGEALTREEVLAGDPFRRDWLDAHDALLRARDLNKLTGSLRRARALDRLTTTRPTWNGHNASAWKRDLLAVNGFDERMSYPVEDRELGERLRNFGLRPVQVRHRAVCLHLDHEIRPVASDVKASNARIRRASRGLPAPLSRLEGLVSGPDWTEFGVRKGPRPAEPSS